MRKQTLFFSYSFDQGQHAYLHTITVTFRPIHLQKGGVREEVSYRDASQPKKFAHTQKKHVDHLKISRGIFQHKNFGGGDDSG